MANPRKPLNDPTARARLLQIIGQNRSAQVQHHSAEQPAQRAPIGGHISVGGKIVQPGAPDPEAALRALEARYNNLCADSNWLSGRTTLSEHNARVRELIEGANPLLDQMERELQARAGINHHMRRRGSERIQGIREKWVGRIRQ